MKQKNAEDIKLICQEYCEEVEIDGYDVTCLVNQKYLKDLKLRVSVHGWSIQSLKKKHFLYYIRFFDFL
jgi:hypothetical protein